MIDISIEEAMRCLQLYQEYLPEQGYVFQCFNIGISALKTLEDMQQNGNYIPAQQNISLELIEKLANYKCLGSYCDECPCAYKNVFSNYNCASAAASVLITDYPFIKHVYEWLEEHRDIVAQWKEEIERRTNNE